jgi:uncharacterized membrane protein YeaQ/YmgE (transglycosylase-associated protein family)
MGIIAWVVLGLLAGLIARAIMPGHQSIHVVATMLIGVAGAVIGGFVAELLGFEGLGSFFELRTWVIAVGGSLLLLAILHFVTSGRGGREPLSH